MKLAVFGLGLIGGSMALDLKASGFVSVVIGVDANPEHGQEALELELIDRLATLEFACKEADLIILATPVSTITKLLPIVLDQIGPQTTVTDVGSTKALIAKCVENHTKKNQFVPSHPMAGTEFSGPQAAHRGLFRNKAAIICESKTSDKNHIKRISEMYQALQMRVITMEPENHDLHAAYVSHLSHISSFVLANTVLDKEKNEAAIFNLASAGFESTVRLAKSSPEMWAPIFEQNNQYIIEALGAYLDHLKIFHENLKKKDFEQTKKDMQKSNDIKRVLEQIQNRKPKE
ncbi:MAG: prephenate dehydrogenase [Bacteriovoracaceae bacterium]